MTADARVSEGLRTDCASATVLVVLGLVWTNRSSQLSARERLSHATGARRARVAASGWPQHSAAMAAAWLLAAVGAPAAHASAPRPRAPLKVADQRTTR